MGEKIQYHVVRNGLENMDQKKKQVMDNEILSEFNGRRKNSIKKNTYKSL